MLQRNHNMPSPPSRRMLENLKFELYLKLLQGADTGDTLQ